MVARPDYFRAMKTLSMTKVLGAGIFLNDRDAAVVQDGYANPRYCSGYNGTQYRTANVERTNGYEKNIYETSLSIPA